MPAYQIQAKISILARNSAEAEIILLQNVKSKLLAQDEGIIGLECGKPYLIL